MVLSMPEYEKLLKIENYVWLAAPGPGGTQRGSCMSCYNTNYRQNTTASKQKLRRADLLNCEISVDYSTALNLKFDM